MASFIEKVNLKEKAEEDLYFARLDSKLIQALHKKEEQKIISEKELIGDIRLQDKH
ncbi:MAG: hypothetical protein OQK77_05230 [Psychromonas sp.]|nr:hypothetical protein [Psychromonas sp.]